MVTTTRRKIDYNWSLYELALNRTGFFLHDTMNLFGFDVIGLYIFVDIYNSLK